jgi:hypothetical protein
MKESLPPIPTPVAQRWREFRIQILPIIVFVGILAAILMMWRNFVQPPSVVGEAQAVKAKVAGPEEGVIADMNGLQSSTNRPNALVYVE